MEKELKRMAITLTSGKTIIQTVPAEVAKSFYEAWEKGESKISSINKNSETVGIRLSDVSAVQIEKG